MFCVINYCLTANINQGLVARKILCCSKNRRSLKLEILSRNHEKNGKNTECQSILWYMKAKLKSFVVLFQD